MRIIALMNQKGGVGKTTTTVNLGAALAERGRRVCLMDLDPQAHLTINYGLEPAADLPSLYNVLVEEMGLLEALHKISDRIALLPSSIDLAAAEVELVSVLGREMLLKKRMEAAALDSADLNFDYVLLDCPPSLGLLTINALAVAREVIIPMQPHFLALQGVAKLLETVQLVNRRMNPQLAVSGIVLTMFDSQTKLSGEVVAELNGFIESAKGKALPWANARIFKSKIRRNIKLAESPSFGQTILKYDGGSNGAADYRALAAEVLAMEPAEMKAKPLLAAPTAASVVVKAVAPRPAAVAPAAKPVAPAAKPVAPGARPVAPAARPVAPALSVTVNPNLQPSHLAAAKAIPASPAAPVGASTSLPVNAASKH
jgi:chromosome partitioning protein